MIAFLQGKIIGRGKNHIILNAGDIGYKVFLSEPNLNKIPKIGEPLKLHTYLHLREETMALYGFLSQDELELFEIFNEVSGIGPKAALLLSGVGTVKDLRAAVDREDFKIFEGLKGIGHKKIQRIVLELSGKFKRIEQENVQVRDEALEALINLGFARAKAKEALDEIPQDIKDLQERIKTALKILGRGS